MKQPFIFLSLTVTLLGASPALAQNMAADLLPAYEVATIVTSMGMRPLDRPLWRNGRYIVHAIDRDGREVRVVLDARDGHVLAVRPRERDFGYEPRDAPPRGYPRPAPYDPRYGAPPQPSGAFPGRPPVDDDEFFDDDRQQGSLMPPADQPEAPRQQSSRAAPARSASASAAPSERAPAKTPLPRPRPAQVANAAEGNAQTTGSVTAAPPAAVRKKPDAPKEASKVSGASDPSNAKPAADAAKKDIRVIEISKPKPANPSEDKPGEPIRF